MVVEIRDWCQNVGEYNTYKFCIWHFGLCVIVSKIDRCRSSDPPYEIAINPIFRSYRVSDVIIQSFLNRSRWNLVHTLVARRARSAISDCLVLHINTYKSRYQPINLFSDFTYIYWASRDLPQIHAWQIAFAVWSFVDTDTEKNPNFYVLCMCIDKQKEKL